MAMNNTFALRLLSFKERENNLTMIFLKLQNNILKILYIVYFRPYLYPLIYVFRKKTFYVFIFNATKLKFS